MNDEFWGKLRKDLICRLGLADEEDVTITDYQSMDNGSFEVVVFNDSYESSQAGQDLSFFWIAKNRKTLTHGKMVKERTAGEVLALYIQTVVKSTITYEPYGGAVELLDRGEFFE